MSFRAELILCVAKKNTFEEFVSPDQGLRWKNVVNKISSFVLDSVQQSGCSYEAVRNSFFGFSRPVWEVIKNSYDSFFMHYLANPSNFESATPHLIFKTVVCLKGNRLLIKFKDNGNGFFGVEKGVKVDQSKLQPERKLKGRVFGGQRMGLRRLVSEINSQDGDVYFKNRKDRGAAVYISFPIKEVSEDHKSLLTNLSLPTNQTDLVSKVNRGVSNAAIRNLVAGVGLIMIAYLAELFSSAL